MAKRKIKPDPIRSEEELRLRHEAEVAAVPREDKARLRAEHEAAAEERLQHQTAAQSAYDRLMGGKS